MQEPAPSPKTRSHSRRPTAPIPHTLLLDLRISEGAVRLWGMLHVLQKASTPITITTLMSATNRSQASVYRWIDELKVHGYLVVERAHGGLLSCTLLDHSIHHEAQL